MSQGTTFRIFAVNNDSAKIKSLKEIHDRYVEDQLHSGNYWFTDEDRNDKIEEAIHREGYVPFMRVYDKPTEEEKKYQSLGRQVEDPFPVWIETASGKEVYEIYAEDFLSDFNELYQHLGISGSGATECKEISRTQAKEMLDVVNYILKGNYNREIEEAVFEDNEFFHVFEEQYWIFERRFKKNRKQNQNQQTIKIVIKDERVDVEREKNDEYSNEDYDYEEEDLQSEKDMKAELNNLRSVLETFLNISYSWKDESELKVIYKLVYFKWF